MVATIPSPKRRAVALGPIVIGASVAIASAFAVSVAYTLRSVESAQQALPPVIQRDVTAIAHETVLRSDLQQVEQMLAESTEGHPWEPGAMRRMLESVDHEAVFTRTLYPDAIDARLRGATFDAITRARSGIDALRTSLDAGAVADARNALHSALRPQLHHADAAIGMLLQSSVDEIGRAAIAQETAREQATRIALLLDAICVFVASGFGTLAILAVRREHARLRAQVAELEIFADRVAHDIRGPLTPVVFALHEAERGASEPLRGFVERAKRSVRVVEEIVDGLHSFARSTGASLRRGHTDVRPVIEDVLANVAREAEQGDVQLAALGIEDVVIHCDAGVLASIVSNLLRNAIRHMGPRATRRVTIGAHVYERHATVVVQDTGPGLPKGFEARAFLPYARPEGTRRAGLGLGLATVKRLAEGHGGSVTVESTPLGCTFVVELPIWRAVLAPAEPEPGHGE